MIIIIINIYLFFIENVNDDRMGNVKHVHKAQHTTLILMHYFNSYGIRIQNVNVLNRILVENANIIQYFVKIETNVSNNYNNLFTTIPITIVTQSFLSEPMKIQECRKSDVVCRWEED